MANRGGSSRRATRARASPRTRPSESRSDHRGVIDAGKAGDGVDVRERGEGEREVGRVEVRRGVREGRAERGETTSPRTRSRAAREERRVVLSGRERGPARSPRVERALANVGIANSAQWFSVRERERVLERGAPRQGVVERVARVAGTGGGGGRAGATGRSAP